MGRIAGRRKMYRKRGTEFYVSKRKKKPVIYNFAERSSSYLKYLRVTRMYIQKKYNLTLAELELILFLYDESIFDRKTFEEYSCTLGFNSLNWFQKLKDREIIKPFREEKDSVSLYTLTPQYKIVVNKMYKHLEGEKIPESSRSNPLFEKNATFSDKMYARLIKQMNKKREG